MLPLQIQQTVARHIEKRLITRIEEIEGRVPTNAEVEKFGLQVIHPDGKVSFCWRGKTIVEVHPLETKDFISSITITG